MHQLTYSPDGRYIISCGDDGRVIICDQKQAGAPVKALMPAQTNTAAAAASLQKSSGRNRNTPPKPPSACAAISPDGKLVAVSHAAASGDASITLFSGVSFEAVMSIETSAAGFERWVT